MHTIIINHRHNRLQVVWKQTSLNVTHVFCHFVLQLKMIGKAKIASLKQLIIFRGPVLNKTHYVKKRDKKKKDL